MDDEGSGSGNENRKPPSLCQAGKPLVPAEPISAELGVKKDLH